MENYYNNATVTGRDKPNSSSTGELYTPDSFDSGLPPLPDPRIPRTPDSDSDYSTATIFKHQTSLEPCLLANNRTYYPEESGVLSSIPVIGAQTVQPSPFQDWGQGNFNPKVEYFGTSQAVPKRESYNLLGNSCCDCFTNRPVSIANANGDVRRDIYPLIFSGVPINYKWNPITCYQSTGTGFKKILPHTFTIGKHNFYGGYFASG